MPPAIPAGSVLAGGHGTGGERWRTAWQRSVSRGRTPMLPRTLLPGRGLCPTPWRPCCLALFSRLCCGRPGLAGSAPPLPAGRHASGAGDLPLADLVEGVAAALAVLLLGAAGRGRQGVALSVRGQRHAEDIVAVGGAARSEEHTAELQTRGHLVCRRRI